MVILIERKLRQFMESSGHKSTFWRERVQDKAFHQIPVLKKTDLIEIQKNTPPFGDLSTYSHQQLVRIFMSPGPIYDPQGNEGDYWRFSEALYQAGFREGDIVQNTFSYHLSPAGFMFDAALIKLGITVVPAGVGNTELQLQIMKDVKVNGYVGTPSFLNILLEKGEELGYRIGKELQLEKAFFTAEKLTDSLKESLLSKGVNVAEGYGTADVGCIAYEDGQNRGLKVASDLYVEICDPATGQQVEEGKIGEIVVTHFDSTYPLIRFGTGDLSTMHAYQGATYLSGIMGRVGDGVKVKGMFVHLKQLAPIIEENREIHYYQCVVERKNDRDHFTIYIEAESILDTEMIRKKLANIIRIHPAIKILPLDSIRRDEGQLLDKRE